VSDLLVSEVVLYATNFNEIGGPIPKLADWAVRSHSLHVSIALARSVTNLPRVDRTDSNASLRTAAGFIYFVQGDHSSRHEKTLNKQEAKKHIYGVKWPWAVAKKCLAFVCLKTCNDLSFDRHKLVPAYAAALPGASRPGIPRTRSQGGGGGNVDGSASSRTGSASAAEVNEESESEQEAGSDSDFVCDDDADESS